jgi:hypothetical protein
VIHAWDVNAPASDDGAHGLSESRREMASQGAIGSLRDMPERWQREVER